MGGSFQDLAPAFISGAVGGMVADLITHPIGTVKTRLQVQGASGAALTQYTSSVQAARYILRAEGVGALYSGVGVVLFTAAPAQGLFFLGNDAARAFFRDELPQVSPPLANFAAGFFAQLCGSLAWVPMDTIKERLQVEGQLAAGKQERLGSSWGAVRGIFAKEGLRGFYPAYWVHQFTWAPFNGLYFALYEQGKSVCEARDWPVWPCGVVAGVFAGGATNPMDLVKTRLQVARCDPGTFKYAGAWDCCRQIVRAEGPLALFDGVGARVLLLTPRLTLAVTIKDAIMPWCSKLTAP
ncbi:mitochondrial carrier domain-containing protein [Pelagophyceae sp. CCMP2097]|nr:mitochondrial carrier domain-containing protein [Pelagophyceae sp. CCMP2097]